jgi:Flp pilus assembly protein TadG
MRANEHSVWKSRLGALIRDRRGTVAIAMSLLFVPAVMTIGAAVDYARLEQFKTQLQATVDSAALSGAAAYVTAADSSNAQTVAGNYITSNENLLPSHVGSITDTVAAAQVTTGSNQGYTVTVNATATIATTFMQLVTSSLSVSASATAVNPTVTITITTNNFQSSAWDGNTLWYWLVSSSDQTAIPNPNNFASSQKLASNVPGNSTNANVTFTASATQLIGIALQNVTGEVGGNYGCNQYQTAPAGSYQWSNGRYEYVAGTCQGSTQWFFSNIMPPSDSSYNVSSIDTGYVTEASNCSLQTSLTSSLPTSINPPTSGSCLTSLPSNSTFSCRSIGSQYLTFYWNDMGGNVDDYDYNDAEISVSCSGTGTGNTATGVYLSS